MSATASITNTDRLNYLNIGLILLSCIVAFMVPFELFLFSYAVLGPLHYLTEISWLHERNYFSKRKTDFIFLTIAGLILFMLVYITPNWNAIEGKDGTYYTSTIVVYVAFIASLAMVVLKDTFHRFIAFIIICASAFVSKNAFLLFSVFMPTLIHVFLFTGLFMLYGALKGRSRSGYLSCIIFFLVPFVFIYYNPDSLPWTEYAYTHYQKFWIVNFETIKLFDISSVMPARTMSGVLAKTVFTTSTGMIVMRFIAFAYTYHYLNWFSKTTVIKWHQVPKKRLIAIGVLWIASVAFYLYKYELGFNVLFLLSFLHVFLEFPLNHVTIIGIFKEAGDIMRGKKTPIPVKGNLKPSVKGKKN